MKTQIEKTEDKLAHEARCKYERELTKAMKQRRTCLMWVYDHNNKFRSQGIRGITYSEYSTCIVILADELAGLHKARQLMKQIFPNYTDELAGVWAMEDYVFAEYAYTNKFLGNFLIRVDFKGELPNGLLKPGCKIVEVTKKDRTIICEVSNEA